jgi:hypothetical protein
MGAGRNHFGAFYRNRRNAVRCPGKDQLNLPRFSAGAALTSPIVPNASAAARLFHLVLLII